MELLLRTTLHKAYPVPPCENHPTRMEALEKEMGNYVAGFMNTGAERRMLGVCIRAGWVTLKRWNLGEEKTGREK